MQDELVNLENELITFNRALEVFKDKVKERITKRCSKFECKNVLEKLLQIIDLFFFSPKFENPYEGVKVKKLFLIGKVGDLETPPLEVAVVDFKPRIDEAKLEDALAKFIDFLLKNFWELYRILEESTQASAGQ